MMRATLGQGITLPTLSADGRRLLARGLAGIGFAYGLWAIVALGVAGEGGSTGTDALAYWTAGQAMLGGGSPYGAAPGEAGAYLYAPIFVQVVAPLTLLPAAVFVWGWRLLEVVCLRVAVGSWTGAGVAILVFPPVVIELAFANVNLIVAAVCALVMRGGVAVSGIPVVVKGVGLPLVPLAFLNGRAGFVRSWALLLAIVAVSVALAPSLWREYLELLSRTAQPTWWTNLSGDLPLAVRLAVGLGLGLVAIRFVRLAPIAVFVAQPIVWLSSLSILVAVVAPVARSPLARGGRPRPTAEAAP